MLDLPLIIGVIAGIFSKGVRERGKGRKLTMVGILQALTLTVISIPFFLSGVKFLGIAPTLGLLGMIAVLIGSLVMYGVGVLLTELVERGLEAA